MKYMISCRHTLVELEQCDEIRVDYKDIARLADFITDKWKCEKDIYIYIPKDQLVDWDNIGRYAELLSIYIAVEETAMIEEAHMRGFKTFWSYPATSFWELRGLLDLGVCQVLLDAPLYFDIPKVKEVCGDVEIRLVVNRCVNSYMKRTNGICGTYVRPEDVYIYEPYVSHMEFDTGDDLRKEMTLLRIYKKDGHWPGNLNLLLTDLGENVDNRGFDEGFGEHRLDCRQTCQRNNSCHYCRSVFLFITTTLKHKDELIEQLREFDKAEGTLA